MTEPTEHLRDARLAQALKHMPDAHMQPGAQARSAVLQEAARAVGAGSQRRWWQNLLGQPGPRRPWNTAFASLALAVFVTVLWYEQEPAERADPKTSLAPPRDSAAGAAVVTTTPDKVYAERKLSTAPARPTPSATALAKAELADKPLVKEAVVASAPLPQVAAEATASPATPPAAASPAQAPAAVAARRMDLAQEQRSRANLSAGATAGAVSSFQVTISQGGRQHSVPAQEAQPLLVKLRALAYSPAVSAPVRRSEPDGDALVVEITGQQRWVITASEVSREKLSQTQNGALADAAGQTESGAITPAQYTELHRLALEIAAHYP